MANYTVTNNNDDGVGSLRWAIAQANSNGGLDTIDFEVNSVVLTTGINITDSLNVSGNGVTITQTGSDRIFNINDNTADLIEVNFDNLTLTGGNPVDTGGTISASENVSISNSQLLGNETSKRGGAIYLEGGALFIANTTISDNKIQVNDVGPSNGGAIYIRNGVLDLVDSTISANEAYAESISLAFSTGTISNTQINNNPI